MKKWSKILVVLAAAAALLAVGCGKDDDDDDGPDFNLDTGGMEDTARMDTGGEDSGSGDTGAADTDQPDAEADTGDEDTGAEDTGGDDTGTTDTGEMDSGGDDTGTTDTGASDTGGMDTGVMDTGTTDTGGSDTGLADTGTSDTGTTDTGTPDVSGDGGTAGMTPGTGDLVITEFMANPSATGDAQGEWVEIYNPSQSATFKLGGCFLKDKDSDNHKLMAPLTVGPGAYVTLAKSAMPGFTPDYNYGSGYTLANGGDEIVLECGSTVVDEVDYNAWESKATAAGAAAGLNPTMLTAAANDMGSNWCKQSSDLGNTDKGTPGGANDACP